MKRTIKLAVVAALALGATSAFATNGATMIAVGAKARGMGGASIGVGHGAESALSNPALITTIKGNNEISFGGTVFMPDVETDGISGGAVTSDSEANMFVIPSVSLASKVNDNFYWGIGMWGTGGLGVDYRTDATTMNMVTALQTMQFAVPMAYTNSGFTVAVSPIIQYSALDINYVVPNMGGNPNAGTTAGAGVAQDVAIGFNAGLAYETNGITIGAVYKSEIQFDIDDVLDNAIAPMTALGVTPAYSQTEMETPAEYGVGVSYTTGGHTLAVDYKNIAWSDAKVYEDFGWEDQDVVAIGYEYATDGWAVRCGYQYASAAVEDNAGKGLTLDQNMLGGFGLDGVVTNSFNAIGFPGTMESHITLGGTYAINDTLSVDLAAVYGLEDDTDVQNFTGTQTNVKHSESSYSVQLSYAF